MSPGNFSYTLQTLLGTEGFTNRYEMYNTKLQEMKSWVINEKADKGG